MRYGIIPRCLDASVGDDDGRPLMEHQAPLTVSYHEGRYTGLLDANGNRIMAYQDSIGFRPCR